MFAAGTRRICRVGLAAVLVTALCVLTLVDLPPQLPDPPPDPPPTADGESPGTRSIVAYSWARRLALDYRPSSECARNGSVETTLNAFEFNGKEWLETIPGRLFLYSAHLDLRVVGYPSVRVIGVKRGSLRTSALFCTIWYKDQGRIRSFSMEALISDIWLDEWGGSTETYTGILVTCPLATALNPSRVVVSATSCAENPSHSLVVNSASRNSRGRRQFTMCIKGLDFEEDISRKLVAFVELHRLLGAKFFYFYVFSVHQNVLKVLRLYERSNVVRWVTLSLPGDLPKEKLARRQLLSDDVWIKRRMELIPYNHCFYENLYHSEFVIPIDIDETIVPARRKDWTQVMLDERKKLGRSFKDFASYSVRNAYFFLELQKKSPIPNSTLDSDIFHNLNYLDTLRIATVSPEGDSVKSFISTKRALTVHNHYALTTLNPSTRRAHHLDPKDILKHHHRVCDDRHLDCDLLMENVQVDESALRYAKELMTRMKIVLADLNAFIE
ncbi:uncharacterized protein LOC107269944 [Cephus cinctus]|uniref:Glycosyltransferase family 92 protein n=1 Tax=Cephus cinctus TaxID=211228 RepID=A0AAJ7C1T2_CEPCN|nr:uncharacterized protein LOC107269944 [Cephus cinctus]XP_015599894.1 uncharacterized protein LOC107269944 [Cephus cinctus]XP_024942914.1 uncharacterized protein LOC107269944 [Cephus cinctus]